MRINYTFRVLVEWRIDKRQNILPANLRPGNILRLLDLIHKSGKWEWRQHVTVSNVWLESCLVLNLKQTPRSSTNTCPTDAYSSHILSFLKRNTNKKINPHTPYHIKKKKKTTTTTSSSLSSL
jgi:hypothetical protein